MVDSSLCRVPTRMLSAIASLAVAIRIIEVVQACCSGQNYDPCRNVTTGNPSDYNY